MVNHPKTPRAMELIDTILENLNDEQRQTVTTTEGYIRVVAGAGSGKTRSLTRRFMYLVEAVGIEPENILCITFTNKAAFEMRQRIKALIGNKFTGTVCTFHGFCVNFLRDHIHKLQYPSQFVIADAADCESILSMVYAEKNITMRQYKYKEAIRIVSTYKTGRFDKLVGRNDNPILKTCRDYDDLLVHHPNDELKYLYDSAPNTEETIFYGFLYYQKLRFALDFNDIIQFSLDIFDQFSDIRRQYCEKFEYIMIDEFQDIDDRQYKLMSILSSYHQNLFIVGDPDQTIYTWRGAQYKHLIDFEKNFPEVKTIQMMLNYRSTPQIVDAANDLIACNAKRIPKSLIATRPSGVPIIFHHDKSPADEADWIAKHIQSLVESESRSFRDFAVLVRSSFLTAQLERALSEAQIPFILQGEFPFFSRAVVKDVVSYLRMLIYRDDFSFERIVNIPARNIGKKKLAMIKFHAQEHNCSYYEALKTLASTPPFSTESKAGEFIDLIERLSRRYKSQPLYETIDQILTESGYERQIKGTGDNVRLDDLSEFRNYAYEFYTTTGEDADLEHFLTHIALFSNRDIDMTASKVKVMTIHAAKGLEFPVVYIYELAEGTFPSHRCANEEELEQERRLAFVACTRARDRLILSDAEFTRGTTPQYTSRFVCEIGKRRLICDPPVPDEVFEEAKRHVRHASSSIAEHNRNLKPGDVVRHPILGKGTILAYNILKDNYTIQFEQMSTARVISAKVKLEVIDSA